MRSKVNSSKRKSGTQTSKASHDSDTPKALLKFMLEKWKPSVAKLPSLIKHAQYFRERRKRVSRKFPKVTLIIPTGHEQVRSNDTFFRFRPGSDFYYLTGNVEPDCVLVLSPKSQGGHRSILFVEPNPGRTEATFYTDRQKGELWVGPRLGIEQSRARFGVDECRPLSELEKFLKDLGKKRRMQWATLRSISSKVDRWIGKQPRDAELATFLSEIRLYKDNAEIVELQSVIDSTKRGFEDVIVGLRHAKSEREVEGLFYLRARTEGYDVGYGTIAACGHHACILHWTHNDGALDKNALLLLDAGVEGRCLYTADVTRTLPVGGKFSKEQREIYDLVLAAQRAAMNAVKPGNDFMDPNKAAMRVLAHGLADLGILQTSAEEALKEENQFYRRYSLHNVSHMLGLDVHDCAKARKEVYKYGKLKPGMVLTIEPGLYFQLDDLTVPSKYRGIGIRIEDDVLVTKTGFKNLSAHIPTSSADVETWMAKLWKSKRIYQGLNS